MKERIIKFRIWQTAIKRMDKFVLFDSMCAILCSDKKNYGHGIVMQFTGLHDKNGKEIYEGDILKHEHARLLEVKWGSVGWVLFSKDFARFGLPNGTNCGEFNTSSWIYKSEIIGNIYQNPELLPTEGQK